MTEKNSAASLLPDEALSRALDTVGARAQAPWLGYLSVRAMESETLAGLLAKVQELEQVVGHLTLENERMRKAQESAYKDWLTGLPNRRAFEDRFAEELARAQRTGRELSVAVIDLDGLKAINDSHGGHATGDKALRFVAEFVRRHLRQCDFLARYGGDEFIVLLPEATRAQAEEGLLRVQAMLDERGPGLLRSGRGAAGAQVSFSFGVAERASCGSAQNLVRSADVAMYRNKARRKQALAADPERSEAKTQPAIQCLALVPDTPSR